MPKAGACREYGGNRNNKSLDKQSGARFTHYSAVPMENTPPPRSSSRFLVGLRLAALAGKWAVPVIWVQEGHLFSRQINDAEDP